MPVENNELEENKKEETKKKQAKAAEDLDFEEQLAEQLYNDKTKAGNIQFFSFYFDEEKWRISRFFSNKMSLKDSRREAQNRGEHSPREFNVQAAREGRLFIVSDKAPYLRKVNVDERGKVSLEVVTRNPIKVPEGLSSVQTKAWKNLYHSFYRLVNGNTAESHWGLVRGWRNWRAKSHMKDILNYAEEARKKEMREAEKEAKLADEIEKSQKNSKVVTLEDELEREPQAEAQQEVQQEAQQEAQVHQEVQQELEAQAKQEVQQGQEVQEKQKENDVDRTFDQAMGFVKEGNHQEAAALVAQEMQNLSQKFNESKYMDENAIDRGMEMRQLMEKLKKSGSTELLDALEKNPEFKENKNLYQGQENLAEIGKLGQEARERLKSQEKPTTPEEKQAERNALLDLLAGEYASSLLVRKELGKDISGTLKKIGKQPDAQKLIEKLKDGMGKTNTVEELMEGTPEELHNMFTNSFTTQREYKKVFSEAQEIQKKEKEKAKELQNENKKENQKEDKKGKEKENEGRVLSNQDKRMKGPSMGK